MSTATVGLFENKTQAQTALQELVNAGFPRAKVELISRNGGAAGTEDFSGQLTRIGVPDGDARLYSSRLSGGKAVVTVQAADSEVSKAESILERNGAMHLDEDGATSHITSPNTEPLARTGTVNGSQETVLPVIEEELQVGKRDVPGRRVRIYPHIVDEPVDQQVNLRHEHIEVQHRAVDRPVEDRDLRALKQGADMTETNEEPVVQKTARVVEEIIISKNVTQENRNIHDTVRKTEVNDVEGDKTMANGDVSDGRPIGARSDSSGIRSEANLGIDPRATNEDPLTTTSGMPSAEPWKKHANQALGTVSDGGTAMGDADITRMQRARQEPEDDPAHQYGTKLATDPRYKGKEWRSIEPEAEREWPQQEKGAWQEFKDKVRHAWEKMSGERS